jgi:hypothetical protein
MCNEEAGAVSNEYALENVGRSEFLGLYVENVKHVRKHLAPATNPRDGRAANANTLKFTTLS